MLWENNWGRRHNLLPYTARTVIWEQGKPYLPKASPGGWEFKGRLTALLLRLFSSMTMAVFPFIILMYTELVISVKWMRLDMRIVFTETA